MRFHRGGSSKSNSSKQLRQVTINNKITTEHEHETTKYPSLIIEEV